MTVWNKVTDTLPIESRLVEFYVPKLGPYYGRMIGYLAYHEHDNFEPTWWTLDVENITGVEYWRDLPGVPDA